MESCANIADTANKFIKKDKIIPFTNWAREILSSKGQIIDFPCKAIEVEKRGRKNFSYVMKKIIRLMKLSDWYPHNISLLRSKSIEGVWKNG